MKKTLVLIFILFTTFGFSQDEEEEIVDGELKALVINAQSDEVMESVHVVNLNQVIGTITNEKGEFNIKAAVNDTLYFSFLCFKAQKIRVTNDMFK